MKKALVKYIAVAIIVLASINLYKGLFTENLTDEEIMNEYIAEYYGENCCGKLRELKDYACIEMTKYPENFIEFVVYEDDTVLNGVTIEREYYQNRYK